MTSIKSFPFETILDWYQKNGRHTLPWRQIYQLSDTERLYRIWIAEVMLQQTQVDRVIGYYTKFLLKYPTIESLAETNYEELFPYYQGLGYYGRARRMIELAKTVVEKYDGIFPDNFETLRRLPGVGAYTAQALLAFGYNQPILALDANLQKIFARYYFGTKKKEKRIKNKAGIDTFDILTSQLQKQVQKENISGRDINNALMDFGALVSTTYDRVDRDVYPLPECEWFQTEGKKEIKEIKTKKQSLKNKYSCLVFLHENHKKYLSSHKEYYEPFLITQTSKDDRTSIQDYFSATYGLEVSVRPSFGNGAFKETPVQLFHTQIQTGKLSLPEYSKEQKENWVKDYLIISPK